MPGVLSGYNTGHQTARAVISSANLSERREIAGIKDEVAIALRPLCNIKVNRLTTRVSSSPWRENVAHTGTGPASRTERRQEFKL